jgi:hypothetical protein
MESILHYRRKLLNFPHEPQTYITHTIPQYKGTPGLEIIGPSNEHSFCRKCNVYHITYDTPCVTYNVPSVKYDYPSNFHIKLMHNLIKFGVIMLVVWLLFFKKA